MLPGPENIGGEDRDKEGRKGESLSLVESPKIGKAEAVQCVHGSASGEARSSTKVEGTEINCDNHRCSNEGSLSSRDKGPQTSCINRCCEEGGGDSVGVENNFDSSGEEGEVEVDGSKTSMRDHWLQSRWELGETSVRPRWRSKGGLGSIHSGIHSSSRLSFCSNAESDCDIVKFSMLGSDKSAHLFFADTRYCCDDRLLVGAESILVRHKHILELQSGGEGLNDVVLEVGGLVVFI
ncbi:hypothetical protein VNO80_01303 [Phaseolus coccineus]|uniref:Uncharacterized protein n=1 Tax=Phaseolus coccineus TaxID=3886 RepID=A0AAN9RSM8_PHACN